MKKSLISVLLLSMLSGAVVGTGVYKAVKTKQEETKTKSKRRHIPYSPYEAFIKPPLAMLLSGLALAMLSPLMAVTALLVKKK